MEKLPDSTDTLRDPRQRMYWPKRVTEPSPCPPPAARNRRRRVLGSRQETMPQYGEGFWFVIKAHPPAHIEICAGGCNAEDGPKDQ
jgi:hypothetical protein